MNLDGYKAYEVFLNGEGETHYVLHDESDNPVLEVNMNNYYSDSRFTALKYDFNNHRMLENFNNARSFNEITLELFTRIWTRALAANDESEEDSFYYIKPDPPLTEGVYLHYRGHVMHRIINPYIRKDKICWNACTDASTPEPVNFDFLDHMVHEEQAEWVPSNVFEDKWSFSKKHEECH